MKRLLVPIVALASTFALSIPAAAFIFGGAPGAGQQPFASPKVAAPKRAALSPDGTPVRVIVIPDTSPTAPSIPAYVPPANADVAPEAAEIKEEAAPARPVRLRKAAARTVAANRDIDLGALY
jgi:hypothetical protein